MFSEIRPICRSKIKKTNVDVGQKLKNKRLKEFFSDWMTAESHRNMKIVWGKSALKLGCCDWDSGLPSEASKGYASKLLVVHS